MITKLEPLILAIETATRGGSIAVSHGAHLLASLSGKASESHSLSLLDSIDAILKEVRLTLSDVDLFAAALGPGSFTGLRIGLATAKALSVCSGQKIAGVSTLAAIAYATGDSSHTLSLLPAGRGELFAQLFSVNGVSLGALDQASHLSPSAVLKKYENYDEVLCAGEGAETLLKLRQENHGISGSGWRAAPAGEQLAAAIAALALVEFTENRLFKPEEIRAIYVRPSDAEINEQRQ